MKRANPIPLAEDEEERENQKWFRDGYGEERTNLKQYYHRKEAALRDMLLYERDIKLFYIPVTNPVLRKIYWRIQGAYSAALDEYLMRGDENGDAEILQR